jgi:ABC-type sugar transport system permease subunit
MPKSRRFFSAQNKRELLLPALFLAPALAVLLALSIYPLIYSITISLQQETSGASRGASETSRASRQTTSFSPRWATRLSTPSRR